MRNSCEQFLSALFADYPADVYVELRFRTRSGMARAFYPVDRLHDVAAAIGHRSLETDVYVGVLPRRRQASAYADLAPEARVLWADCDTTESAAALADLVPVPSIVVASGSGANRHAYWLMTEVAALYDVEIANRGLAHALGADEHCADPARILRPPSRNHKNQPPAEVRLIKCEPAVRYPFREIADALPGLAAITDLVRPRGASHRLTAERDPVDPLLAIQPSRYIEELTGLSVLRTRKVRCPFHDDSTPSLHVYDDPARGWYCFGCRRGGSIYDFAGFLWDMQTRGHEFAELRRRLELLFDFTDLPQDGP